MPLALSANPGWETFHQFSMVVNAILGPVVRFVTLLWHGDEPIGICLFTSPPLSLRRYLTGEAMTPLEFEFELSGLRWLAGTALSPRKRFAPSEKVLRYSEQPELY